MRATLKDWMPTIAVLLTAAGLLAQQARSQGALEAKFDALAAQINDARHDAEMRYDALDDRVTRIENHEDKIRAAATSPLRGILVGEAYADTTKRTEVPRPHGIGSRQSNH